MIEINATILAQILNFLILVVLLRAVAYKPVARLLQQRSDKIKGDLDKAEADRIMNYPYAAVEEILSSAVYHRSYQINEPITVRITPESMEVTSFPGFDNSITDESIKALDIRARAYRNRRIGDFLKELHLTEGRNTGFRKILNALKRNGSPLPEFITDEDHSFFLTRLLIREGFDEEDNSMDSKASE